MVKTTWVWRVTGYGPKIKGNKYGNREGFKTVDVTADTKAEATEKALAVLPENRREELKVVQYVRITVE